MRALKFDWKEIAVVGLVISLLVSVVTGFLSLAMSSLSATVPYVGTYIGAYTGIMLFFVTLIFGTISMFILVLLGAAGWEYIVLPIAKWARRL